MDRPQLEETIRAQLQYHFQSLGFTCHEKTGDVPQLTKDGIRLMHSIQKSEQIEREAIILVPKLNYLLSHFAEGYEVNPAMIDPEIIPVESDKETAYLFRLATLLWSVPVSRGFGRRMRFLVKDRYNGKLIGIFALGDPVFNLAARDKWIGWNGNDRRSRLVNVMDAFVVGAVPPYSQLLGGKLVTSLIGSQEVSDFFMEKYEGRQGIISGQIKQNFLALVTITSALGRSSIYNRLTLPGIVDLKRIGETRGWGHFHVPGNLFELMRQLLIMNEHPYATGYKYGCGPNWRMRVVREALKHIGMEGNWLRHGIVREVYAMPLSSNWQEYLQGVDNQAIVNRPSIHEITEACLTRWIIPRSERRPEFLTWTRNNTRELFSFFNFKV